MYITRLHVKNMKLMRDLALDFTHEGKPRMWTAFVAENGACNTTLLQAIALAASGPDRANQLADVPSLPDLRRPAEAAWLGADFEFGTSLGKWRILSEPIPFSLGSSPQGQGLRSSLSIGPAQSTFSGISWFAPTRTLVSIADEAHQREAKALDELIARIRPYFAEVEVLGEKSIKIQNVKDSVGTSGASERSRF
jgi:hypothetical protein